ncbi:MAG: glycosyltransferase, partial [Nostocales cyanobacterium W4_Combined_metabat2_030]|nr:glycosyltransferase [Nostocales cyanobacterium W4_Combined_metabat2_030]
MYRNKRISLVIPAYNEEKVIGRTLQNIPELIDRIYVVDDCSPDKQNNVISRCAGEDK